MCLVGQVLAEGRLVTTVRRPRYLVGLELAEGTTVWCLVGLVSAEGSVLTYLVGLAPTEGAAVRYLVSIASAEGIVAPFVSGRFSVC